MKFVIPIFFSLPAALGNAFFAAAQKKAAGAANSFTKESLNGYHRAAIVTALITVVLFSLGQNSPE